MGSVGFVLYVGKGRGLMGEAFGGGNVCSMLNVIKRPSLRCILHFLHVRRLRTLRMFLHLVWMMAGWYQHQSKSRYSLRP